MKPTHTDPPYDYRPQWMKEGLGVPIADHNIGREEDKLWLQKVFVMDAERERR